jgi:hypothetical protein
MTRDDIIRLAVEAKLVCHWDGGCASAWVEGHDLTPYLERFAALVAVQVEATWQNRYLKLMDLMEAREGQPNKPCCLAEREACAKVCEEEIKRVKPIYSVTAENCVKAIRARGQE